MKAPNRSTVDNDHDSETSGGRERKYNNNNKKAYYSQAATLVANGLEHCDSIVHGTKMGLRAFLNEFFCGKFLKSYGSLFW